MPVLSLSYGIIFRMHSESGAKHNKPHVHAEYSGEEVVISLEGEIIRGTIPRGKLKLVLAWMEIHQDDLLANWHLLDSGEQFFRIEPLK